ncbi:MHYT domain-containing protein [Streptomyces poonensis]|uniref:Membrane protein n=1 Tax=Streptomyces poonensis TaxID=68255 RepID=A0A918PP75_9ACTN|nr:MHYT domain-containing protein [Streptomyces poonensis]GGZ17652.1 membrane protein [Streptomyces poonensis]GLJ90978.1 membrane protein [Streptomyces poonensis]
MQGTVDGFSYGAVTPVVAYVMACLGGALGLRCVVRSVHTAGSWKPGWPALGAASIGCGIWTMHFIGMVGFRVEETRMRYDVPLTVLSLVVAIVVVAIGVFAVGYRGVSRATLGIAGTITGLGVAAMHYMGMAAIELNGTFQYNPVTVALSVLIAIAAATAALWAAVSIRGFLPSLGASLVMGLAVSAMHYTGMAAVDVHLHTGTDMVYTGESPTSLLLPMMTGPGIFLIVAAAVVMFDPLLVMGDMENGPSSSARRQQVTVSGLSEGPAPLPGDSLFQPSPGANGRPQGPQGRTDSPGAYEW